MLPGIPDIIACIQGRFVGIEVKNKGKLYNQSEQQKIHEKLIKDSGGIFILADSLQAVKDELCRNINNFYLSQTTQNSEKQSLKIYEKEENRDV